MLELIFGISVLFNAWQYVENDNLSEQVEKAVSVNTSNRAVVNGFSVSLAECSDKLINWKNKELEWKDQAVKTEVQLNELDTSVSSNDWGDCRVPADLEL